MEFCDGVGGVVGGVVIGVAASVAFAIGQRVIDLVRMRRAFGKYHGTWHQTRKFPLPDVPGVETLEISVERNVLSVRFSEAPESHRSIHGEVMMNKQLRSSGEGHYDHIEDDEQMWGFWDVQVKDDDTILVHTEYASTDDTPVRQGYIWRRASL